MARAAMELLRRRNSWGLLKDVRKSTIRHYFADGRMQNLPQKSVMPTKVPIWSSCCMHGRQMSCCAGLGSPPPREIVVEYCEDHDHTDHFIKLANAIEDAYPELVVSGNPDDMQSRKGSFEIRTGDTLLYSKLKTNRMPELGEVLRAIDRLPPLMCEIEGSKQVSM